VERVIVQAAQLRSVGYNGRNSDLELEFQDGSITLYLGVPAKTWIALMNTEDKDAYYAKNIKDIYIYRKLV
jgi:hypothetical protein